MHQTYKIIFIFAELVQKATKAFLGNAGPLETKALRGSGQVPISLTLPTSFAQCLIPPLIVIFHKTRAYPVFLESPANLVPRVILVPR